MKVTVERVVGWNRVLNSARTTIGKESTDKEPSDAFKLKLLVSEHSPIRNLMYEVNWLDIPYWVAMHLARHHIGFHSGEDDTIFIKTQRSDRTNVERDKLPQDAPVIFKAVINAHSIINVSRVRLCKVAARETVKAWSEFILELSKIEPMLAKLCKPNCIYRGMCPEPQSCGYYKTRLYSKDLDEYKKYCHEIPKNFI